MDEDEGVPCGSRKVTKPNGNLSWEISRVIWQVQFLGPVTRSHVPQRLNSLLRKLADLQTFCMLTGVFEDALKCTSKFLSAFPLEGSEMVSTNPIEMYLKTNKQTHAPQPSLEIFCIGPEAPGRTCKVRRFRQGPEPSNPNSDPML